MTALLIRLAIHLFYAALGLVVAGAGVLAFSIAVAHASEPCKEERVDKGCPRRPRRGPRNPRFCRRRSGHIVSEIPIVSLVPIPIQDAESIICVCSTCESKWLDRSLARSQSDTTPATSTLTSIPCQSAPAIRGHLIGGLAGKELVTAERADRSTTLLDCIRRYELAAHQRLARIAQAWGTPHQAAVLAREFPRLKKISVDYAVMEPASHDRQVRVAAIPMLLQWTDVGAWPMFAEVHRKDRHGNAHGAKRTLLLDSHRTLAASSDPRHLIATIGCDDLIIIHTPEATLVCRKDCAEQIKELHLQVGARFGNEFL